LKRFGVFNRGLKRLPALAEFVGGQVLFSTFIAPVELSATLGWGRRKYARRAMKVARERGIPFWCLEDGFLRSVGLGHTDPPLSIVVDDVGIYYDATAPSRLESLILRPLSADESARTKSLMAAWRCGRVSKYNHLPEYVPLPNRLNEGETEGMSAIIHPSMHPDSPYVLVADQTYGDASVRYGSASPRSFQCMLQAALQENPDCTVLVKIHPDVFSGRKKSYFNATELSHRTRVRVMAEDVHPVRLIEAAKAIYVVTSQLGFEGLLWGKPVRTFGMPFYAGWGLTQDELPPPQRRRKVALEQLVHAALVEYPRYVNPETGRRCEVEEVLAYLALQRRMRGRFSRVVYAMGFSRWKRRILKDFIQGSEVRWVQRAAQAPAEGDLFVWGRAALDEAVEDRGKCSNQTFRLGSAGSFKRRVIRVEDGFLRSVGLGADLVRPLSWVMDESGIYYDAAVPSDLEHLLQFKVFPFGAIERAVNLRKRIVRDGLTKYNIGVKEWQRPEPLRARILLVPGQVETDASIRFGAPQINSNIALLRAVRQANPGAYVIYKPHPDVVAGLRKKGAAEDDAHRWCDEIVVDVAMHALIEAVDEVHVLTSLAGFEALLREKTVVTYGQPFYAGWGLTRDMVPVERRTRKLSLDELVAGVLIEYPTYVSRTTGRFTTPERALIELLAWRQAGPSGLPWWRQGLRWVLQWRKR
jgi:capsular polysaccharide export protein